MNLYEAIKNNSNPLDKEKYGVLMSALDDIIVSIGTNDQQLKDLKSEVDGIFSDAISKIEQVGLDDLKINEVEDLVRKYFSDTEDFNVSDAGDEEVPCYRISTYFYDDVTFGKVLKFYKELSDFCVSNGLDINAGNVNLPEEEGEESYPGYLTLDILKGGDVLELSIDGEPCKYNKV